MNFDIGEFLVALVPAFTSIATFSNSSWGERVIWLYELVNKSHSTSYLIDHFFSVVFRKDFSS